MASDPRILRGLAAILFAASVATPAFAQLTAPGKAVVEIKAPPQHQDPHPITYFWEGENEPIKEPVKYYSYYYTGTVNPDATVPAGEEIQRVAIANEDWVLHKAEIVQYLTSYYEEAYNIQSQQGRPKVAFDEDYNYVEVEEESQGPLNPRAAAEWSFYYDQFVLWQFYCRRVLLNETDATEASSSREDLQRQADVQALQGFEGIDVGEALKAAEEIRKGAEAAPGAPGGPAAEAKTAATTFSPADDYKDPFHNLVFRDEFIELAKEREQKAADSYTQMLQRIEERATENQRIAEWVADKNGQLRDFAKAWGDVQKGDSLYLEDTFVLITEKPLDSIPYNSINVLKRDRITPADLIKEDGTLKKSEW